MKTKLKKYKMFIRIAALVPFAIFIPIITPISLILLTVQLLCFGTMFYIGWDIE